MLEQGDTTWEIPVATYAAMNRQIEGFAAPHSVNKGETVNFYVNVTDGSPSFKIEIYRMGWYKGAGARLVHSANGLPAVHQPLAQYSLNTDVTEYSWSISYSWTVPSGTGIGIPPSGIYIAKIRCESQVNSGYASYIIFTVRDDQRASDIIFKMSDNTWQAYNGWPYQRDCLPANPNCSAPPLDPDPTQWGPAYSGKSLYGSVSWGVTTDNGTVQPPKVSFNRPYLAYNSNINFTAGSFFMYEYNMLRFLERGGYDVTYCSDIDFDDANATGPNGRLRQGHHKMFLSVGHDEYWSWTMRDNVEKIRDFSTNPYNLAFFSANTSYYQVRYENGNVGTNTNKSLLVSYKQTAVDVSLPQAGQDPFFVDDAQNVFTNNHLITNEWRMNRHPGQMGQCSGGGTSCYKQPENAMMGVMTNLRTLFLPLPERSNSNCPLSFCANDDEMSIHLLTCNPSWICRDLRAPGGVARFGNLIGYETDTKHVDYQSSQPPQMKTIGSSPTFFHFIHPTTGLPVANPTGIDANTVYFTPNDPTGGGGAKVFSIGTIQFAWGVDAFSPKRENGQLEHESRPNTNAETLTINLLGCFIDANQCQ